MSDADDGFDREAERRKLEEKYGDEDESRASTQRMSDLLLKGATMTNSHCDSCGDPIFRQNGQEFCPTCSAEGTANEANANGETAGDASTGDETADEATADTGQSTPGDAVQRRQSADAGQPGDTGRPVDTGQPADTQSPQMRSQTPETQSQVPEAQSQRSGTGQSPARAARRPSDGSTQQPRQSEPERATRAGGESSERRGSASTGGDLAAARAALTEAVTTHATRGAEATDPRTAADHLAAAREAAEALSTLRR